ncbi:MAG: tRNA pseudouridine(13) synthase TruD [Candidatus Thorarchaeota archaeon]|nr:tRNA pseudouridine(13) synthase TruD [Candidatus Thorarchaeota archaeon]
MESRSELEASMGMEMYSLPDQGIGGKLKTRFEDFVVEEIRPDGSILGIADWNTEQADLHPSGEKDKYVSFVVQKMGLSTMDVSRIIASELGIPQHLVTYAGLKDKRAITTQMMSIPRGASTRLGKINLVRIAVRSPIYTHRPVQVGDLWGNRFTILLASIEASCEKAHAVVDNLKNCVLLNYFGVQRFGVTRPVTHLVGKWLVKKDYEAAARVLLTETSPYESEDLTEARGDLANDLTPNASVIDDFPEDLRYERDMLHQLAKHPNDYKLAFSKVPSRVLTLFVHSFQSYLFNRLISMRARKGLDLEKPQPGDFIIQLDETHSGRDSWLYTTQKNLELRVESVVTGRFGLAAPLPGYSTKTPPSIQTEMLMQILEEEDVHLLDFRNRDMRALDSSGGFHLVSLRPHGLEVECMNSDLRLRFNLRKGSYATVVLREIMKNHPINRV